jgi:hypothetical protein
MEHVEVGADLDHGGVLGEAPRGLLRRGVNRRVRRQEEGDIEDYCRELDRDEEDAAGEGHPLPAKCPPESFLGSFASNQARSHQLPPITEPNNVGAEL